MSSLEARTATNLGAVVLPLISTGGASSGKMDFPTSALEKQSWATEAQWNLIKEPNPPEEVAQAVIDMIESIMAFLNERMRPHELS